MPVVDVDRLKEQGRRFVDGFTPGQKAMTILGVVAVVLAGMMFMKWASTPEYAPLYTGLSSQDAGSVTQQLDSDGVKYKLAGGGGTILVAKPDVYKVRVSLSAKGLPSGGDSYAILDKQGITTDQFTRNIDYQRALQGELSKTIETIDTVQSANVTLTIPKDTVFVGAQQDKATAAVVVKTTGGDLPNDTVNAIVHIVASSIPNMNADDVTVADSNGKVLHAPGMDLSTGGSAQVEAKQNYENAVEKQVSDMIASTLGPGHAAITVAADLDMSKGQTKTTTYTNTAPGTQPPIPLKTSNKTTQLTEPAAGGTNGILGVGNNGANATGGNGNRNFNETTSSSDNAVNSQEITADNPPGALKRMSVSAVLDSAVVPADQVAKWTSQIQAAAGIVPSRDGADALQVSTVQFAAEATSKAKPASGGATSGNPMFDLIKQVLTLLMIGLILVFAWRAIKKAESNRVPLRVPLDIRELEAGSGALALDAPALTAAAAAAQLPARKPIEPPPTTLEGEITELIERQPDEVAQTLRSWLADRRS